MSEELTPAATEPASTTSIIEHAIADLPDDSGAETSGDTVADDIPDAIDVSATPDAGATVDPTATPTAAEIDELAQALGISGSGKAKWTARIPYSKISKVWKEQQAKQRADHEATLQQHTARLREVEAVERMIAEQPEQFVRALVEQNPAYQRYFSQAPAQPAPTPVSSEMPAPDVRLADGSQTYSVEGLRRLLAWNTQQTEQRVEQRIKPFEQERQQREMLEAAVPHVKQQIADAEKWPLFKESKNEILAALQADPRIDLTGAYQRVVIPKLAANRDQVRQDVLKELASQPHSTSVTRTTPGRADESGAPRDSRDIIRQSIAGLAD